MQKGEIMNQQEIDRLWVKYAHEWDNEVSYENFTAAIQEAVAMAQQQAWMELISECRKDKVIGDMSYWSAGYKCALFKLEQAAERNLSPSTDLTLINEGNIEQSSNTRSLTLTAREMRDALEFCNPDGPDDNDQMDDDVVIEWRDAFKDDEGNEHPAGLYAYMAEYPEEGFYGPLM